MDIQYPSPLDSVMDEVFSGIPAAPAPASAPVPEEAPPAPAPAAAPAPAPEAAPAPAPAPVPPPVPEAAPAPVMPDFPDLTPQLDALLAQLQTMGGTVEKIGGEIREMHKLYHNGYSGRLTVMQAELDRYHEVEKGRSMDGILTEIAKIYCDYEGVVEQAEDPKLKKQLRYLFLDLVQLLEGHGVSMQRSEVGAKRSPRFCQVIERIPTADPALHDTIARSRVTGFSIDNRPLVKEMVDVYLLSKDAVPAPAPAAAPAAEPAPEAAEPAPADGESV